MLSYQSLMPAGAGTPRYENETWSLEVFGCGWCHPSPLDSGLRRNDEWGARRIGEGMPRMANERLPVGAVYPGSESGTCFRTKDEMRGRECRSGITVWTKVVVSRLTFFRGMLVRGFPPSRE